MFVGSKGGIILEYEGSQNKEERETERETLRKHRDTGKDDVRQTDRLTCMKCIIRNALNSVNGRFKRQT